MDRSSASKPAGAEAALSLQEELVAAIHGAFEVAVEIAVREVKKVVAQTAGDLHEEMRRENESLKQRLQRAEAMLGSARTKERGGSPPAEKQLLSAAKHPDQKPQPKYSQKSPEIKVSNVHSCRGIGGASLPACYSCAQQPVDHLDKHVRGDEEHRLDDNSVEAPLCSDTAADPEEERNAGFSKEVTEGISHVRVKVESINQPCQDLATLPSADDRSTLELVTVKQEKQEEERDDSICSLDLIKVEDFSLDCMFDVESKMLVDWEPEMPDAQSQDPNTQFSCTKPAPGLPPPTDLPSLSSPEPAPIPVAPPKIYEVRVRTSRNLGHTTGNLYTCKSCGQSFHLPSHLRRHYSQCPQKHQQRCQQPVTGSKRTRLQLYPPGCSPFRCTECDRDFNRMENLKTHLRIHTGERPYTCSVCSKCFRHSGALTRHFRIHTGEKPYVCGQCGKSFRNCGGLKFHQRSHSKQLK